MTKQHLIYCLVGCLLLVGLWGQPVLATSDFGGILIKPEVPADNLGGADLGYFNIKAPTIKTRTLQITVINPNDYPVQVQTKVMKATTNDDGGSNYEGNSSRQLVRVSTPTETRLQVPAQLTLDARQTKKLTVQVHPGATFIGRKAAGIVLSVSDQHFSHGTVANRYVYAVELTLNGPKLKSQDYRKVMLKQVQPRQKRQPAISVQLRNPNPAYLKQTTVTYQLQNQHWPIIKYQYQRKALTIAPDSTVWLNSWLQAKRLVPGTYDLTLKLKNGTKQQQITRVVRINRQTAQLINQHNQAWQRRKAIILWGTLCGFFGVLGGWLFKRRQTHVKTNHC